MASYETFWDEISRIEEVDFDDEKINRLIRFQAVQQQLNGVKRILDVGAGTGAFSVPLARKGYEVVHFDLSEEMLKQARENAAGVPGIRFVRGDAADLSRFADGELDLVLCFDGAISFSGRDADKVLSEICRVGKKVILTVSSKACMVATWLNYSMLTHGRIHPSVKNMLTTGYFNKADYDDAENMTAITELQAYDCSGLTEILQGKGMKVLECRSIGSLTHLYLMHLYRLYDDEEVRRRINEISADPEFLELCELYDKTVMPEGMGSFRRSGILAIAEKA